MGVRGLETFAESGEVRAIYPLDIKEYVSSENCPKGDDGRPVLLVDLNALKRPLYRGLNLICGGEGPIFKRRLKKFINAFKDAGIRLVFIADGSTPPLKRKEWVQRRYDSARRHVIPLMEALDKNDSKGIETRAKEIVLPQTQLEGMIDEEEGVEKIFSVDYGDGDRLMAEKVIEMNGFGILTQDSDFLIFQFNHKTVLYLSLKHFDFDGLDRSGSLRTKVYDQERLQTKLGIYRHQLPILAAMKGNDFVDRKDLLRFHRWVTNHGQYQIFWSIAKFIRNEVRIDENLQELGEFVFYGDKRKAEVFVKAVDCYFLDRPMPKRQSEISGDEKWCEIVSLSRGKAHKMLVDNVCEESTRIEDYRVSDVLDKVPVNSLVYLQVHQRIYGILRHEQPSDVPKTIEAWRMTGLKSLDEPQYFEPTPAPEDHPGLKRLWSNEEMDELRFKLYAFTIHPDLDHQELMRFAPQNLYLISVLYYLQNCTSFSPILYKHEVEAFIEQHLQLMELEDKVEIQHVQPSRRGVCLATLYTSSPFRTSSKIVGNPVPQRFMLNCNNFYGTLFQKIYLSGQSRNTQEFMDIYNFVTKNSLNVKN